MVRNIHLIAIATLLLAGRTVHAKDLDGRERAARTACLAGDYAKGVAILSELFVTTKNSIHIYNQGRCFEQNRRYQDAIGRFQEFLRVGDTLSQSDRTRAEQHIASCQALLAGQGYNREPVSEGDSRGAKERTAKKACLNGDPTKGIELLTDLYVDTNDPTYIFNQGRCFEQNNLCEQAIVRFREYLRKTPNGTERDRTDVAKHITDCEALLVKKGGNSAELLAVRKKPEPTAGPAPAPPVEPPSGSAGFPTPGQTIVASPTSQHPPGAGLRLAGTLTMGVGAALVVAGAVLNLEHNSAISNAQVNYSASKANSAQRYETWSIVGYGVGAACLTSGAVLYWLGHRTGKVLLAPSPVASGTGLLLAGAF